MNNLGAVKGPQPLKFIPALTTCAAKRMKTRGFRTLRVLPPGSARERQNPKKLEEMALAISSKISPLDSGKTFAIIIKLEYGEMSEWFMELVLKTSDAARHRGFESLSLRHFLRGRRRSGEVPKRPKGLPC